MQAQEKEERKRREDENLTFKPKTNAYIRNDNMAHFQVGQAATGMQRYLQRQEQAREMKAEKERIEAKVFRSGTNWKPTPTVPRTPKISVPVVKGERNFEPNVKALSKPVNSIRKQLNADSAAGENDGAEMLLTEMNGYETLGMPNGSAGKARHHGQKSSA